MIHVDRKEEIQLLTVFCGDDRKNTARRSRVMPLCPIRMNPAFTLELPLVCSCVLPSSHLLMVRLCV